MTRPNILVVFNDDHGQWALPAYGNTVLRTPSLDWLAQTGAVMENAFTPIPVCSPARACFMTGRLPSQHGLHDYIASGSDFHDRHWLAAEVTLPELLADAGYQVGLSGKWHLGNDQHPHPGFHSWFALSGDYPIDSRSRYRFSQDGELVTLKGYKSQILTDRAIAFLRARDRDRPFFLFMGHTATHSPWADHPERLVAHYRQADLSDHPFGPAYRLGKPALESATLIDRARQPEALAQYYAAVSCLDEATGRLLDELEGEGSLADTLVVYTSDHGLCCGHHGIWGKGNGTLPLNMLEESIRIPLLMAGHRNLIGPQRRGEPVDHLDLFQSLLEAAGLPAPAGQNRYPGRSFWPLLTDQPLPTPWRAHQFGEYGPVRMIRTPHHKLVHRHPDGPHELYDLIADPGEETNLYTHPDQAPRVTQLSAALKDHFHRFEVPGKSGLAGPNIAKTNQTSPWAI